jgi:hypothetical protein
LSFDLKLLLNHLVSHALLVGNLNGATDHRLGDRINSPRLRG